MRNCSQDKELAALHSFVLRLRTGCRHHLSTATLAALDAVGSPEEAPAALVMVRGELDVLVDALADANGVLQLRG